jgi:sarcosine oxidase subunit beta
MGISAYNTADVVVIGGGLIGCSTAYYLQKEGLQVSLIERGQLCSGASGSNQGGATFSRTLQPLTQLALESMKIFGHLEEELDYDFEFQQVNYLMCAADLTPKKEEFLKATFDELRRLGAECRLVMGKEVRELDRHFGESIEGGIAIEKGIYMVWPFKLAYGLAHAAKRLGATILTGTEVTGLKVEKGGIRSVKTDYGDITAKYVVNAAGCWSGKIGEMVGLEIPVKPRKGQIVVTEPTELHHYRYLMDVDYLTVEHDQKEDIDIAASVMQQGHGNWTIGSSREMAGFDIHTSAEAMALLVKKAASLLPALRDLHLIRSYAGLRPSCYIDGNPILGETEEIKGFVIATGHDGSGVKFTPATGKLIAQEIATGRRDPILDPFRYSRFRRKSAGSA